MANSHQTLAPLLNELLDGSAKEACWILNPDDGGLLGSLDGLSAEGASALPAGGGASIAAHVDHLRYGLSLLNRWSRGEDVFKDTDYSASWRRLIVSGEEWALLRRRLRAEAQAWQAAVRTARDLTDFEWTAMMASVAHLAYHLGAIRQIDRSLRGPAASD